MEGLDVAHDTNNTRQTQKSKRISFATILRLRVNQVAQALSVGMMSRNICRVIDAPGVASSGPW